MALRPRRLALRQPPVPGALPDAQDDAHPGPGGDAPARPLRDDLARRRPLEPHARPSAARASRAPARRVSPTSRGTTPCSAFGSTSVTLSHADSVPPCGIWSTTTLDALARSSPACRRRSRAAAAARAGPAPSRASRRARRAPRPRSSCSRRASAARAPVKKSSVNVFRQSPLSRSIFPLRKVDAAPARRTATAAAGTTPAASLRYASAFVMNAFQISAGYVPPATGLAVVLGLHRPQLVRVADPDRGHELRACSRRTTRRRSSPSCRSCRRPRGRGSPPRCPSRTGRRPGGASRRSPRARRSRPSRARAPAAARPRSPCCTSCPCAFIEALDRARLVPEDRAVDPVAAVRERRERARHLERRRRLARRGRSRSTA